MIFALVRSSVLCLCMFSLQCRALHGALEALEAACLRDVFLQILVDSRIVLGPGLWINS